MPGAGFVTAAGAQNTRKATGNMSVMWVMVMGMRRRGAAMQKVRENKTTSHQPRKRIIEFFDHKKGKETSAVPCAAILKANGRAGSRGGMRELPTLDASWVFSKGSAEFIRPK